jgi:hypothetical protein
VPTGIVWLDKAVADAQLPQTVDTEGGCLIVGQLEGHVPSTETFRRWPIKYRLVGKVRLYEVEHVLEFVRTRFRATPVRLPAAQPRVSRSLEPKLNPNEQTDQPRLICGRSVGSSREVGFRRPDSYSARRAAAKGSKRAE